MTVVTDTWCGTTVFKSGLLLPGVAEIPALNLAQKSSRVAGENACGTMRSALPAKPKRRAK